MLSHLYLTDQGNITEAEEMLAKGNIIQLFFLEKTLVGKKIEKTYVLLKYRTNIEEFSLRKKRYHKGFFFLII